jgi:hypothetical protein
MAEWMWLGGAVEVRQRHGCRSKRDHDLDEKGATVSDILPVFGGDKSENIKHKKSPDENEDLQMREWMELGCSPDNLSREKE